MDKQKLLLSLSISTLVYNVISVVLWTLTSIVLIINFSMINKIHFNWRYCFPLSLLYVIPTIVNVFVYITFYKFNNSIFIIALTY
ncbi:hypothetical protein BCF59_0334 [Mycoplasmopsis mustelae]|uniref:Uncharacterized protein n=1 Tax=Mycoplasmopsis mustelae TaxID=171289 RepID=A0A4R7UD73_9BACT|nr:hypothetical protein BCF59_0334 [Mycoplasmopsis mustelae]